MGNIVSCKLDKLNQSFDVIINATSASLGGKLLAIPENVIDADSICYDMMYGSEETLFNQWAKHQGAAQSIDGLGMLVGQAAESFYQWRQVKPEVDSVLKFIRDQLEN